MLCGGSVREPAIHIEQTNDAAELGTTVDRMLTAMVEGRNPHVADQPTEARILYYAGLKMWQQHKASFPDALCQYPIKADLVTPNGTEFSLSGTTDITSGQEGVYCHSADWKSGRVDSDYKEQMLGYCGLPLLLDRRLPEASDTIFWIRDQDIERHSMSRDQLPACLERLYAVVDWDGTYHPGSHCSGCQREHECPARLEMVRKDVQAFFVRDVDFGSSELRYMSASDKVDLLHKAKHVAQLAEAVTKAIKADVTAHGDIEGVTYRLTLETSNKRHVDPAKAWGVLEDALTYGQLAACVDVSISKVEEAVRANAPPRKGAERVRELNEKLNEAGAVTLVPSSRLVTKRKT